MRFSSLRKVRAEEDEGSGPRTSRTARTWRTGGFSGCGGYKGASVARPGAIIYSSEYECVELRVPRVEVSKMSGGSSWRREEMQRG